MKRTKKVLALVLALMMAFTTLVMPAAAEEAEAATPRLTQAHCDSCGREVTVYPTGGVDEYYTKGCTAYPGVPHTHTVSYNNVYYCVCGYTGHGSVRYGTTCNYPN